MKRFRPVRGLILGLIIISMVTSAAAAVQTAPVEVGAGSSGQVAFEVVAVADDRTGTVSARGYLTEVAGLDTASLFTDPDVRSAATARLTLALDVGATASTATGDTTVQDGSGTLTIYLLNEGGADPAKPASFTAGTPIAGAEIVLQDIVQMVPPDLTVVVAEATIAQDSAAPFSLDGETYQFGHAGLQLRLAMTGSGAGKTNATVVDLAGNATVVDDAGSSSATAATPANGAVCAGTQTWLTTAQARLDLAAALVSGAPATLDEASDAVAIRSAAAEISGLTQGQRSNAIPSEVGAANRLLVTALSTIGRGLSLLADAVEQSDSARFDQGRRALNDGAALASRATTALAPVAASCGIDLDS